jgi:hypothetical protein
MAFKKLDKVFEDSEKLVMVKLSSDPKDKSKTYIGYLVNEAPAQEQKATKLPNGGFIGTIARAAKGIGGAYRSFQKGTEQFKKFAHGDYGVLADWADKILANLLDKQTTKLNAFGQKGYNQIILDRPSIIEKLDRYVKGKVPSIAAPIFTSENMEFAISNRKSYTDTADTFILTPMDLNVANLFKQSDIGITMLVRTLNAGLPTNNVSIYFYNFSKQIIAELTTKDITFTYDGVKNAYIFQKERKVDVGFDFIPPERKMVLKLDSDLFKCTDWSPYGRENINHTVDFYVKKVDAVDFKEGSLSPTLMEQLKADPDLFKKPPFTRRELIQQRNLPKGDYYIPFLCTAEYMRSPRGGSILGNEGFIIDTDTIVSKGIVRGSQNFIKVTLEQPDLFNQPKQPEKPATPSTPPATLPKTDAKLKNAAAVVKGTQ